MVSLTGCWLSVQDERTASRVYGSPQVTSNYRMQRTRVG
jgi:hypothetical protein